MKRFTTPIIDVKKYGGKQVAIVKGKIVASGITTREVLENARKKLPHATWRDILLVSVPIILSPHLSRVFHRKV
ncbi:MAG: hypothetical protein HYT98_03190 [Candidatus Sungbacteria bacterium]|nr:hypothetical protein [Candidatus Sungbacteria bacterium]